MEETWKRKHKLLNKCLCESFVPSQQSTTPHDSKSGEIEITFVGPSFNVGDWTQQRKRKIYNLVHHSRNDLIHRKRKSVRFQRRMLRSAYQMSCLRSIPFHSFLSFFWPFVYFWSRVPAHSNHRRRVNGLLSERTINHLAWRPISWSWPLFCH